MREIAESIIITYDYAATPDVMRLVKEYNLRITAQKFETECELVAEYDLRQAEKLSERLAVMQATGVKLQFGRLL